MSLTNAFGDYLLSFIFYPLSFIPYLLSFIARGASIILSPSLRDYYLYSSLCDKKQLITMKHILTLSILLLGIAAQAQNKFSIGVAAGAGQFQESVEKKGRIALTLPNLKVCYKLNDRWRMGIYVPGSLYKNNGKQRAFESFMLIGQYDVSSKFYVFGGIGVTQDAPAFYTVKNFKEAEFYSGFPSVALGMGYEIWRKDNKRIELQYRFFYGQSNLPTTTRTAISNSVLLGFSWN